ncbi:MAG TPA: hypothetical protein VHM00_04310 [Caldimonas sp.]|jgi:hypothetical protein|nr:hypothetical protein [Caldimonas sp.]HEX2540287.1 hypothetical protein [Caldimonas sp.]
MSTRTSPQVALGLAALLACSLSCGPAAAADAAAKPTAKPAAKPAAAGAKSARKAAPAPVAPVIAEASPEQVKAAEMVYYGLYDCEFQQTLNISANPKHTSYVDVKAGKGSWLMKPVLSSTGAIRLEDVRGETLMVQISSKSMLLNVKSAQRIVDDCISAKQRELIAEGKAAKAAAEAAAASGGSAGASTPVAGTETSAPKQ